MGNGMKVEDLIELVKEIESEDPIDFGMLNISEDDALRLIALDVLGMFGNPQTSTDKEMIMLATVTKLVLENFVLNLRLHQRN